MKLRVKGKNPETQQRALSAEGSNKTTVARSLSAQGSVPVSSGVTLSVRGKEPEVVDLGVTTYIPPVGPVRRAMKKVKELYTNFIPPVYTSKNTGTYTPPPKAPIFAVIPKGVCKGCK